MTFDEASKFFKNLVTETDVKSEERIYKKIITVLDQLENKNLTNEQVIAIENKLDTFVVDMPRENRKKYYRKKLSEFFQYLQKEFSLISDKYYTSLGMSLGMCFGMSLGMTFGVIFAESQGLIYGMNFGMILGISIGLVIGTSLDTKAKKEGNVLFDVGR